MALQRTNSSSFITTIRNDTNQNEYRVSSSVDDSRVFSVNVYFTKGAGETTSPTYSEAAKKALHDAIVSVLMNEAVSGNKGIGYGI